MEIDELAEQVKSLQAKLEKTTKETEGLQSLAGKWSGEVGEIREKLKAAGGDESIKQKLDALESELKQLKAQPPQGGQPNGTVAEPPKPSERKTPEEKAAELELGLTEDQRKLVEEAYENLDDKTQWDDPKFRLAVFEEAQSQVQSVPKGPWRAQKVEQPKVDDLKRVVKGLFSNARKRAASVPSGSGGVGFRGSSNEDGESRHWDGRTSFSEHLKKPRQ
jgi:hypothetical protein